LLNGIRILNRKYNESWIQAYISRSIDITDRKEVPYGYQYGG
jgi:hypothetical protein